MEGRLAGKVAIVTGAAGGIGRAVVSVLAAEGAAIVANDLGAALDGTGADGGAARDVADAVVASGGRAVANSESVDSVAGAQRMVGQAFEDFGGLDILVNCAGNSAEISPWELDEDMWDRTISIHLKGHFACIRAAAEPMRKQGSGTIVAITSHVGLFGLPDATAYCAAKAGVTGLTKSYAAALQPFGVTVNCVAPSAISRMSDTVPVEILKARAAANGVTLPDSLSDDDIRLMLIGDPKAVANFIAYLATDAARDVTGQIFAVIGGHVAVFAPWTEAATIEKAGVWDIDELSAAVKSDLSRGFAQAVHE
jgi:NAD(P)-dependent dehydrogenase (short-subunit alcohol dehydrogenase family)